MIKATNPNNIPVIPNPESMSVEDLINATYTSEVNQHDFMYNQFVPTIKIILSQLLNSLTTLPTGTTRNTTGGNAPPNSSN